MLDLKQRHLELLQIIGHASVEYLDIPVHNNIGDLLIYLGTKRFLDRHEIAIETEEAYFNYGRRSGKVPILLHGGGNLGDLYPAHQRFREKVISENHHRTVIVLPQTVHFSDDRNLERAGRIFSSHPNLFVCVRDIASQQVARGLAKNVILLPDMAHQLYPLPSAGSGSGGTLILRRTDAETGGRTWPAPIGTEVDWPSLDCAMRRRMTRLALILSNTMRTIGFEATGSRSFSRIWHHIASSMVGEAIDLFDPYSRIVTDRLHAHLLACLLDKPSVVVDNTYGKNSSYLRAWTGKSSLVESWC